MGIFKDCGEACLEAFPGNVDCNMTFKRFKRIAMAFLLLLGIPLQATGMFTRSWVILRFCSYKGLVSSECNNISIDGKDALDSSAFGLQVTSFVIHLATAVVYICLYCSFRLRNQRYEEDEIAIAKFCFPCFLPAVLFITGMLSFVSCMIVRNKSFGQDPEFGYSYYLCLITSILIMIIYALFIIGYLINTCGSCNCQWGDPGRARDRTRGGTAQATI